MAQLDLGKLVIKVRASGSSGRKGNAETGAVADVQASGAKGESRETTAGV